MTKCHVFMGKNGYGVLDTNFTIYLIVHVHYVTFSNHGKNVYINCSVSSTENCQQLNKCSLPKSGSASSPLAFNNAKNSSCARYGPRSLCIWRQFSSCNWLKKHKMCIRDSNTAAKEYLDEFADLISSENYSPQQVYNVDETCLLYTSRCV